MFLGPNWFNGGVAFACMAAGIVEYKGSRRSAIVTTVGAYTVLAIMLTLATLTFWAVGK